MVTSRTLKAKQRTGRGQLIDVSLLRSGLWCNGMMLAAAASAPNNPAAVVRATIFFFCGLESDCVAFNASFLQPKKKKKRRRKSMSSLHFFDAEPPPQHVASFLLCPTVRFLYFSFPHFPIFLILTMVSVTLSDGHCLLHHH